MKPGQFARCANDICRRQLMADLLNVFFFFNFIFTFHSAKARHALRGSTAILFQISSAARKTLCAVARVMPPCSRRHIIIGTIHNIYFHLHNICALKSNQIINVNKNRRRKNVFIYKRNRVASASR